MIFTESTIKISNNVSKMDSTIVLYRGDKNVEIRFTILQSPFKYSNTVATNVIESTNASFGQLVIKTPNDKPPIFSEVSATKEGTVLFTITKEMIDEIEEVGVYTFQIRLMDENKQSRVTIPPVENGIEIKEPIAIEDDNTTNVVGLAKANYAVVTSSDVDTPTFDDNGKYNKTNWNDGDIITNTSLNKIEDGIYTTNENVTATKKYVDDKVTIKILPVDYNKNCATNVADLEPNSIYMSPNDAKFLYLAYEKLSGSLVGFLFTAKAHGRFIYTGVKDDTKIEIMMEGSCYTVYFKTDTVDAHVEKTVFYLTKNNTTEFTPSNDYEPATKKYVDDNTPIKSLPVNPTTKTAATVDVNNITSSGCYALPKRADGTQWTNLRMRAIVNDGSGNSKVLLLTGYQNFVFHVNIESKKIYCDNLRIVYNIGTTADTTYIDTEPYYLPTTNTKEYTPTNDYNPATKKYVDDNMKTAINDVKGDLGTDELTTTAKDLRGAVNELNTQCKDIVEKLKPIKVFESFPDDTVLESLPANSIFEVKGFYSAGDMQKCAYEKITGYASNSIFKENLNCYIKPITSNENIVFLPYYGIRAGKEYSSQNSNILSNITLKHGTALKLPVGDYYFENPIDLKTKQLSLIGECMSFTVDSNTNGITKLIFNNLQEGQTAITIGTGSLFNVCILGNDKQYDYTIDRSKTYTDKNNIEKEVSTIKNYGIKGGAITTINNVAVQNFYYGAYLDTSNIYIDNFFARKCHIGLSIGGDTKCKGVYGWNIHTLLQIRNSISSAIQVRADSCHHLVHLIGYSGSIYLADLDGDYCLGSLLKIGIAGEWGSIGSLMVNGMHGRACCLNAYNTETDTPPTSSIVTEVEVSNYGFISIEKNNRLDGAVITLNTNISVNPMDGESKYLTPQILIASAGVCYAMFNTTFLSAYGEDGSIIITKQKLLDSMALLGQSANNTRISMNTNSGTYYINKVNPTDIKVSKQTVENLE